MSLAEQHKPRPSSRPRCSISVLLDQLDDDDTQWLIGAIAIAKAGRDSFANITATLRAAGHSIRAQALARHAREDCTCEPR